jgi:hypothetical protein
LEGSVLSPSAQLFLQSRYIDNVPVLGKLVTFDAPDVDGVDGDLLPRRLDAEECAAMSTCPCVARDYFVASEDAVFDSQIDVRKYVAQGLDATVLDVRLGKNLAAQGGIVTVHSRHIAFKQGGVCRRFIGCASASIGKSGAQKCECGGYSEHRSAI